jgi:subtilisin family serine protease
VNAGVAYVVAAGNDGADACTKSPASEPSALTIAATDSSDTRASWSNFGTCVDLFAPGVGITSAWHTSTTATNTISGTSMAAPHVAGAAALYLQMNPQAKPADIAASIKNDATASKVNSPAGSPNLLLFTLAASAKVDPKVLSVTINEGDQSLEEGSTFVFTVSVRTQGGASTGVIWSSSNTSVATVTTEGVVTAITEGSATITATSAFDGVTTDAVLVTVGAAPPPAAVLLEVTLSKVRGETAANLVWEGIIGESAVLIDGSIVTTVSSSTYTDTIGRGGGTRSYQVCATSDPSICSDVVNVTY